RVAQQRPVGQRRQPPRAVEGRVDGPDPLLGCMRGRRGPAERRDPLPTRIEVPQDVGRERDGLQERNVALKAFGWKADRIQYIYASGYRSDGTRPRAPGRPGTARVRG